MNYRTLGVIAADISAMGLGCSKFGSILDGVDGSQAERLIHLAVEGGINFFDTANIYGQGQSERLLGTALSHRRDKMIIATKAGQCLSNSSKGMLILKKPIAQVAKCLPVVKAALQRRRSHPLPRRFDTQYLEQELNLSLKRLQTDYVDIFYLHSPCAEHFVDGILEAFMDSLKKSGKIRCWGISCDADDDIATITSKSSPDILQLPYYSSVSPKILARCEDIILRGGSVIVRGIVSQFRPANVSEQHRALAWRTAWETALQASHVTAVLFGTTKSRHLLENLALVNSLTERTARLASISM